MRKEPRPRVAPPPSTDGRTEHSHKNHRRSSRTLTHQRRLSRNALLIPAVVKHLLQPPEQDSPPPIHRVPCSINLRSRRGFCSFPPRVWHHQTVPCSAKPFSQGSSQSKVRAS